MLAVATSTTRQGRGPLLVAGNRAKRTDQWIRRIASKIANGVRVWLLHDDCPDTACGLKLFAREDFLQVPHFENMHRFLPALFKRNGGEVVNITINDRPRLSGVSKYGIWDRLSVGIFDLYGMAWLARRPSCPEGRKQ